MLHRFRLHVTDCTRSLQWLCYTVLMWQVYPGGWLDLHYLLSYKLIFGSNFSPFEPRCVLFQLWNTKTDSLVFSRCERQMWNKRNLGAQSSSTIYFKITALFALKRHDHKNIRIVAHLQNYSHDCSWWTQPVFKWISQCNINLQNINDPVEIHFSV